MRVALVNPPWTYEGSIYFGCREPHLPLELGYAGALLALEGHEPRIFDGALSGLDMAGTADAVARFAPELTVVTTAPSYLFWRCPPPELRVPRAFLEMLAGRGGRTVAVGPHGSVTPAAALRKLGVDAVVRGECEEIIARLAGATDWSRLPSLGLRGCGGDVRLTAGGAHASRFEDLAPLAWPDAWIAAHRHHHHRFDAAPDGPGAEVEASRGCPYSCSFCAKIEFRDRYRRRRLDLLLAEIDALRHQGVRYLYFIDEIFLPRRDVLEALATRGLAFGVQTRIDLWTPEMLDLLGRAGCVSVEAGVESLTEAGRSALDKNCRMPTEELSARLIEARRRIPFVQANLIRVPEDDAALIEQWRAQLQSHGVWANDPVPLFPYPSTPDYRRIWGAPDDLAWERAHAHYLDSFGSFSDIQETTPAPLPILEQACCR